MFKLNNIHLCLIRSFSVARSEDVFRKNDLVIIHVDLAWLEIERLKRSLFLILQFLQQIDDFAWVVFELEMGNILLA
jgi:hypothetical protein